jgi:hypothetical protein
MGGGGDRQHKLGRNGRFGHADRPRPAGEDHQEIVRARYECAEIGIRALSSFVDAFLERLSRP